LGVLDDIFSPAVQLCFSEHFKEEKDKVFTEKLKTKIDRIYLFLGKKDWFLGYLTLADFKIAEAVNYFEGIWPEHTKEYPEFTKLRERFNNLPEIKAYYERPDAIKGPFLPPTAKWY
jgi:glutathione S-transferase